MWYKITIPWGVYNAYLPIDQEISLCSITNPIVCWGDQKSDENPINTYRKRSRGQVQSASLSESIITKNDKNASNNDD